MKLKLPKISIPKINNIKIKFKSSKIKSKFHLKSRMLFLILAFICVILIILSSVNPAVARPFKVTASAVFTPVQKGMNYVGSWISDKVDNFRDAQEVLLENNILIAENKKLEEENTILREKAQELERMQKLYDLDQTYSSYEKVAAKVISKEAGNWFSIFTIDKGTNDGIAVDMNVLANGGLAGIVISVGPNYAVVRSIIDDESNVSAKFLSTSDLCIAQGNLTLMNDGTIELTNINKDAEIIDGDMVVTSQVSDKFLPDILIGHAANIETDSNKLTKSGYLVPVVDFDSIEEVLVIIQLKETGEAK